MTRPQADVLESDWESAQHRAAMLRLRREDLSVARRRADHWLLPTLVALWIVSMTTHLLAVRRTPEQDTLQLVGSGTALALIVLGVIWLFTAGPFTLSARYESPWIPLTMLDRRRIRQQLARKAPLDLEHADVVLELAHQRRRRILGSLAIIAMELPNSLGFALADSNPVTRTLTCLSLVIFFGLGLYCIAIVSRLRAPIRQLKQVISRTAIE